MNLSDRSKYGLVLLGSVSAEFLGHYLRENCPETFPLLSSSLPNFSDSLMSTSGCYFIADPKRNLEFYFYATFGTSIYLAYEIFQRFGITEGIYSFEDVIAIGLGGLAGLVSGLAINYDKKNSLDE